MRARTKAAILIGAVVFMVWVGAKLGGAVENLGREVAGNRAAAMGR